MSEPPRTAVFAYGSLVSRASAGATLEAPVERIWPAELRGWCRGFTQARHNRTCEKTFARIDTGEVPLWILGLAVAPDPDPAAWVNGALIELDDAQAERLDRRELRYLGRDVTAATFPDDPSTPRFDRVFTYVTRPEHRAPEPPPGAVILRSYLAATEAAFAELGPGGLDRFRESTGVPPVEVVDARLTRDEIPPGNPREW